MRRSVSTVYDATAFAGDLNAFLWFTFMNTNAGLDLVIVGGGIGGIICLKYAKDAGLNALLLERCERIGGLWRDLPSWQDIQFRKEDWTLGDLPLSGERQSDILGNIEAWVERFDLSPYIRLNASVTSARQGENGWRLATDAATYEARFQMLGLPARMVHRLTNRDLRARYAKAGINAIMPEGDFDMRRNQLIPGRPQMIKNFRYIKRHQGEVRSLHGKTILVKMMAWKDRGNYLFGIWYVKYLWLALCHSRKRPMPIP